MATTTRLCARLLGAPEWHIVLVDLSAGFAALEATLLAALDVNPRQVSISWLLLSIRDDPPCPLARDSIVHLRDLDRIEVALRCRNEAPPIEAAPSASPVQMNTTPRLRGVKRYPMTPPAARRAAKVPSLSRDASP